MTFINKITREKSNLFILIIALIITETFSVIAQLPSSHFVNGLIIAIFYYIISGIFKSYLLNTLTRKNVLQYIMLGTIVLIGTIVTASWT